MNTAIVTYFDNYTPVGDILVIATSLVFFILIASSYISRTRNFKIFMRMIFVLDAAVICDLLYHLTFAAADRVPHVLIYILRAYYHICLFAVLCYYVVYIIETLHLSDAHAKRCEWAARLGMLFLSLYEILGIILGFGFYIDETNTPHSGFPIFPFGYIFFVGIIISLILKNNDRVFSRILRGIALTIGVAFLVMGVQNLHGQNSFTAASFLLPIYAILYFIHSNPYDFEIGSVNAGAFEDLIHTCYEEKKELLLMSLYLPDFEETGAKYPPELKETVRYFSGHYFKNATLFQISGGHMILAVDTTKNKTYAKGAELMLDQFALEQPKYGYDYKIVFTLTNDAVSEHNEYLKLLQYIHDRMEENSIRRLNEDDIKAYMKHRYILSELDDIEKKNDMYDERVLVFCQPVYNVLTETYDTAEALMRLKLPETGMVFPDQFIPMAEKHNYIQALTRVILAKTCREIRLLLDEGYRFKRISVNFSAIDIREPDFCDMVRRTIELHDIPFHLIAIEITESQNEKDFLIIKDKVTELQASGIKFYLDDFGTGYSNYERILELPFDIIKFDRSLTIASGNDIKSETMVSYLAHLFSDMSYSVLYEGVEDENDETRCLRMCAKYLQGYKYSKPIPIEQLSDFFEKDEAA